jgi:hypothetical protein
MAISARVPIESHVLMTLCPLVAIQTYTIQSFFSIALQWIHLIPTRNVRGSSLEHN